MRRFSTRCNVNVKRHVLLSVTATLLCVDTLVDIVSKILWLPPQKERLFSQWVVTNTFYDVSEPDKALAKSQIIGRMSDIVGIVVRFDMTSDEI